MAEQAGETPKVSPEHAATNLFKLRMRILEMQRRATEITDSLTPEQAVQVAGYLGEMFALLPAEDSQLGRVALGTQLNELQRNFLEARDEIASAFHSASEPSNETGGTQ